MAYPGITTEADSLQGHETMIEISPRNAFGIIVIAMLARFGWDLMGDLWLFATQWVWMLL